MVSRSVGRHLSVYEAILNKVRWRTQSLEPTPVSLSYAAAPGRAMALAMRFASPAISRSIPVGDT